MYASRDWPTLQAHLTLLGPPNAVRWVRPFGTLCLYYIVVRLPGVAMEVINIEERFSCVLFFQRQINITVGDWTYNT